MHYISPALNQYQYQLVGYDKDWIAAGTDRDVTYSNLSAGTYTFMVKAANSDGVWSKESGNITITIHPPWWKTWWAYTLYALLLVVTTGSYVYYRSSALRRQNRLLEEKVKHRTEQLSQSNEELKQHRNTWLPNGMNWHKRSTNYKLPRVNLYNLKKWLHSVNLLQALHMEFKTL